MDFGWWTTGRDRAAVELLEVALNAIVTGKIKGKIRYIFLSRNPEDGVHGSEIRDIADRAGIAFVFLSAKDFAPELKTSDKNLWRISYHETVLEMLKDFNVEYGILAGYMWVVSPAVCKRLKLLNLHPALPGGPAGTWQEVIWQLIAQRADKTGAMMHLVTPELDKGPAVTFCEFSIKGASWDGLWDAFKRDMKGACELNEIIRVAGESHPLFLAIRRQGEMRELPLVVETMKVISAGSVTVSDGRLLDMDGRELSGPYDLSSLVDASL